MTTETTMTDVDLGSTDGDIAVEGVTRGAAYQVVGNNNKKCRILDGLLLCLLYLVVFGCHLLFTTMVFVSRGHHDGVWYAVIMSIVVYGIVCALLKMEEFDNPKTFREIPDCCACALLLFLMCGIVLIVLTPFAAVRYTEYTASPEYQFQDNVTMDQVPTLVRSDVVLGVNDALVRVSDYTAVSISSDDYFLLIPVTSDSNNITVNAWIISSGATIFQAYIAIDPSVNTVTLHTRTRGEVFAYDLAYPQWKSSHPQWVVAPDAVFIDQVVNFRDKTTKDTLVSLYIAWGCVVIVMMVTLMVIALLLPNKVPQKVNDQ
jgi:hypothetical protein